MAQTLACLRGWHVPLAQAELSALISQAKFSKLSPRLLNTSENLAGVMIPTLNCSSGIQCFLHDAHTVEYKPENIEDFLQNISHSLGNFAQRGSLAVRTLRIAGKKLADPKQAERKFLHKGISERGFERKFQLGDNVKVMAADMALGLLHIDLQRLIPEAKKPQRISIGGGD